MAWARGSELGWRQSPPRGLEPRSLLVQGPTGEKSSGRELEEDMQCRELVRHPRPPSQGLKGEATGGTQVESSGKPGSHGATTCACLRAYVWAVMHVCVCMCVRLREIKDGQIRSWDPRLSHEGHRGTRPWGQDALSLVGERLGQVAWAVLHPLPGHAGTGLIHEHTQHS